MAKPATHRLVQPQDFEIVNLRRPFSNFDHIEKHFGGNDAVRRIFSQSRTHEGEVLLVEKIPQTARPRSGGSREPWYYVRRVVRCPTPACRIML